MGKSMAFEELMVWQAARKLVKEIYGLTATIKDYGFNDQIQRAAVSIMNNIAEGYESGSQPMLKKYLLIAKGSCGEVKSMIYIAMDLGYVAVGDSLIEDCKHLSGSIRKFIDNLKR